jgi:hypothetical protein
MEQQIWRGIHEGAHLDHLSSMARCCASLTMSTAASLTMSTSDRTFRAREGRTVLMVTPGCSR